ncbi:MAG TPA: flagellar biosynthesis protein FlhA [Phycisphaerae bacterium]|nr:flagellar biosynthesis protein FlhA [Phycisphaerae bacterium]
MAGAAAVRSGAGGAGARGGALAGGGAILSNPIFTAIHKYRGLIVPAGFIAMIMVLLVPLPTQVLDLLLVMNLSIAAIVLVSVMFVNSPLDLSIFPSLLLGTTLLRLVLNVASTRLILTAGDRANTVESAGYAAGSVIHAFSTFVTGGGTGAQQQMVVGIIIFIILIVIQFVVITKGATRISEVAARFTLDAMPGKQMAIDADLNAGIIKEDEARKRRSEIAREAEFYGAMDGASKFVRGDAIAGIIIVLINIVGGIAIGMLQYHWDILGCMKTFTSLTIGDGLVSQVPALIISLGAGLLVTRSASKENLGEEFIGQLSGRSSALMVVAGFLVVMSFTGMPMIPLWVLALCLGTISWVMTRNQKAAKETLAKNEKAAATAAKKPDKIESLLTVDPMELEVGYGLVQLVDTTKGGDLLERISLIRRQIAIEFGVVVPPIRIRDNMQLDATGYQIKLRGNVLAAGSVHPGQYLAMDSGAASGKLHGIETREPAFGLPAWWISEAQRSQAELMNYTVVEASGVLATHITEVVKNHAAELVTREEVAALLKQLKEKAPALVEEVVPGQIKPGELQKVLQNLLRERVPIRDLETILESLGEWAGKTKDLEVLTEAVRHGLARTICGQYRDESATIHCVTLDPALEDTLNGYIERNERGSFLTLPAQIARQIAEAIAANVNKLMQQGHMGVVLCSPQVRAHVRKLIEASLPAVAVLSYNEIVKGVNVDSVGTVGVNG